MPTTLQFRRYDSANIANTTGAAGEIFIDLDKETVVVQDGATTGGFPLAREGAYLQANSARDQANTARDQANTARDQANDAYGQANTARDTANGAYAQSNGAYAQANGAYGQANGAYGQANGAYGQANTGIDTANGAYAQANGAYGQANGAYASANGAYAQANGAYAQANTKVSKSGDTMTGDLNVAATLITQNVIPDVDQLYNLGASGKRFKDLYLSNSTIYLGSATINANGDVVRVQGLNVATNASIGTANVATLNATAIIATSLTVTDPIIAPSETDSSSYRLRNAQTTRGDGSFGVYQGSASNGNAFVLFNSTNNVWQLTSNSTEGIYSTIITTQNVIDSVTSTSTVNAAALNSVKTSYDQASNARDQANTARGTANDAYAQANAAYADANTRVLKAGDTMTGALDVQNYVKANVLLLNNTTLSGPSNTSFSGERIRLYDFNQAGHPNYAIGVEGSHIWHGVDDIGPTLGFKWYGNTTLVGLLRTNSTFEVSNTVSAKVLKASGTGTAVDASSGDILTNKVTGTEFAFLNGLYTTTVRGNIAQSADYTFRLPASGGVDGFVLATDGTGNTIWSNGIYELANTVREQANTARTTANDAYGQANTARDTANGAYGQANGAYAQANGGFGQANGAYAQANGAYAQANGAYAQANGAYAQANLKVSLAGDTMTGNLNVAATLITQNIVPDLNVTYSLGTADKRFKDLYLSGNTIYLGDTVLSATEDEMRANTFNAAVSVIVGGKNVLDTANGAYAQANGAYGQANGAYAQANGAYAQANSARDVANGAYAQANGAYAQANIAYGQANSARDQANSAYAEANLKLNLTGGSITGNLTISGNLVVQGNATTINVSNLSVNDSIILLGANATGDVADIGFVGHFDRDATATHAGFVRIHSLNEFQIFDNYEIEPVNNVIDISNTSYRLGNVRFNTLNANSVLILGNSVATQANLTLAHNQANAARDQANTARTTANDAYGEANTAETIALNAYSQANTARDQANTARTQANTARDQANTARDTANGAYAQANGAYAQANGAYGQANGAYGQANTAANTVAVYANDSVVLTKANVNFNNSATVNVSVTSNTSTGRANIEFTVNTTSSGILAANTNAVNAYGQANAARDQANTARTTANDAYGKANTALDQANTARTQANSAFDAANNRVLKAGDTMTGNLTMSGATINTLIANITTVITGNTLTLSTGTASNGNVVITANGTEYLRVTNTGNVGIRTTTPTAALEVGNSSFNGGHSISWGQSKRYEREIGVTRLSPNLVYFAWNTTGSSQPADEESFTANLAPGYANTFISTFREGGVTRNLANFSLSTDNYTTEVYGYLFVETANTYYFNTNSDDASDLYIDGKRVADYYGSHGAFSVGNKGSMYLNRGFHKFYARLREVGGGDELTTQWSTDGVTYTNIPATNFFHDPYDSMLSLNTGGVVFPAGNVGIRTTNPTSNLHVVGNANITLGINTATINATTINAQSFITSTGVNVYSTVLTAYDQANAARDQANTARTTANDAYGQANSGVTIAGNAYNAANSRVLKAGDTMTGQLNISSGGLLVTGNATINSLITTPTINVSNVNYLSPNGANTITSTMYNGGTLSFDSTSGQLFSITDSLTGSIFSVNDISGIPSIEVFDTGEVRLAQYSGNVGLGIANATAKLHVVGTANITSNVIVNGGTFFVDTVGNEVGIGTTNPTSNLHVNGSSILGGVVSSSRRIDIDSSGRAVFAYGDNTLVSQITLDNLSADANTDHGSGILWRLATNASSTAINAGRISVAKQQVWTSTTSTQDAYMAFSTTSDGSLSERMRITDVGNIGVGTSNPSYILDVQRASGFQGIRVSTGSSNGSADLLTVDQFGGGTRFNIKGNGEAWFANSTANVLNITATGNVGIGTSSPTKKLHVVGSTIIDDDAPANNAVLLVIDDGVANTVTSSATFRIANDGTSPSFAIFEASSAVSNTVITNAGNMGIGNTAPATKLVVEYTANNFTPGIDIRNTNASSTTQAILDLTTNDGTFRVGKASTAGGGAGFLYLGTADAMTFSTNAAERMRITSDGNIGIGTTSPTYKLEVNGSFAATTKSFVINHPTKPGMKLRYGSLEGPENGVYVRGKLTGNIIELPDYWPDLVDSESITVNLTPIGKHQKLFVEKIENNKVYVATDEWFGKINCYYTVFAERKDVEKLVVEY